MHGCNVAHLVFKSINIINVYIILVSSLLCMKHVSYIGWLEIQLHY